MANVMSFKNVKNKPHRSAFDLSYKNAFTAKVGELLPCFVKEVLPGDEFHLHPSHFTRTAPVNTAAFARIRENVDFFFVPYRLLWDKWTQFITQTSDPHYAASILGSVGDFTSIPFITGSDIVGFLRKCVAHDGTRADNVGWIDAAGQPLSMTTPKLLQYLGYGAYAYHLSIDGGDVPDEQTALNPFRLLAYQKIYYDYFRNSQWEYSKPQCYNLDYVMQNSGLHLNCSVLGSDVTLGRPVDSLFTMRYANYQKDFVMGLNPSAQFGDTSIAGPVSGTFVFSRTGSSNNVNPNLYVNQTDSHRTDALTSDWTMTANSKSTAGISILAIRLAESLQKYREITLTGSKDYKDQIEKHWGVRVPDYASDLCQRVYSYDSMVEISEVVNTNVSDAAADIKGKGVSAANGGFKWKNESNDYGVMIGIYHAEPLLDYQSDSFIDRVLTNTVASSFPVPELDSIGMEGVPLYTVVVTENDVRPVADNLSTIGYAPRYFEYKTSRDIVQGGFGQYGEFIAETENYSYNGGWSNWVSAYGQGFSVVGSQYNYLSQKINSRLLNSIFTAQISQKPVYLDSSVFYPSYENDQLLVKAFFDCRVLRNLSFDGLPY